jgi:hypothetical protein
VCSLNPRLIYELDLVSHKLVSGYIEMNQLLSKNCRIITLGCPMPDSGMLVTGSPAQFVLAFTPNHWQIPWAWQSKRIRPDNTQ